MLRWVAHFEFVAILRYIVRPNFKKKSNKTREYVLPAESEEEDKADLQGQGPTVSDTFSIPLCLPFCFGGGDGFKNIGSHAQDS